MSSRSPFAEAAVSVTTRIMGLAYTIGADGSRQRRPHRPPFSYWARRSDVTEQKLRGAPKYGNDNDWNWSDASRTRSVNEYYGT
jgi:hypothetical protein